MLLIVVVMSACSTQVKAAPLDHGTASTRRSPSPSSTANTSRPIAPPTTRPRSSTTVATKASTPQGPLAPADAAGPYKVVDVVDGDTAKVRIGGSVTTLRLIGIDTPETKDPRRPVECFGREASARAAQLLSGQTVKLTYDNSQGRRDKYGRTLAYVWLPDRHSFEWEMLSSGFGAEYTYDLPYRYQAVFRAAQAAARSADRGLWAPSTCNGDLNRAAVNPAPSAPTVPASVPASPVAGGCDPNYSPCVPLAGHDLNCSDVQGPITIKGGDPDHFDTDGDGVGCEG